MAKGLRRDGNLTNQQIEDDLKTKNVDSGRGYVGSQDTGDQVPRSMGTEVQQNDGLPAEEKDASDD